MAFTAAVQRFLDAGYVATMYQAGAPMKDIQAEVRRREKTNLSNPTVRRMMRAIGVQLRPHGGWQDPTGATVAERDERAYRRYEEIRPTVRCDQAAFEAIAAETGFGASTVYQQVRRKQARAKARKKVEEARKKAEQYRQPLTTSRPHFGARRRLELNPERH